MEQLTFFLQARRSWFTHAWLDWQHSIASCLEPHKTEHPVSGSLAALPAVCYPLAEASLWSPVTGELKLLISQQKPSSNNQRFSAQAVTTQHVIVVGLMLVDLHSLSQSPAILIKKVKWSRRPLAHLIERGQNLITLSPPLLFQLQMCLLNKGKNLPMNKAWIWISVASFA